MALSLDEAKTRMCPTKHLAYAIFRCFGGEKAEWDDYCDAEGCGHWCPIDDMTGYCGHAGQPETYLKSVIDGLRTDNKNILEENKVVWAENEELRQENDSLKRELGLKPAEIVSLPNADSNGVYGALPKEEDMPF